MSEPSLSEIAKVPAGSAFKHFSPLEIWLLRPRKTRRNTVNTFFERRAGTDNREPWNTPWI
jgi:hypothetical protein